MDAKRIAEIRERLAKATLQPWHVNAWTTGRYTVEAENGLVIAEIHPVHDAGGNKANADFIAHSPADIRDLLEHVEELESSRSKGRE